MAIEIDIEEPGSEPRNVSVDVPATLGRAESCSVQLADPRVSGRHVELLLDGDGNLCVKDLGSRNGISIEPGGKLPSGGQLKIERETVLRIGDSRVRLRPNKSKRAALDMTLDSREDREPAAMEASSDGGDAIRQTIKQHGPPRIGPRASETGEPTSNPLQTERRPMYGPAGGVPLPRGVSGGAAAAAARAREGVREPPPSPPKAVVPPTPPAASPPPAPVAPAPAPPPPVARAEPSPPPQAEPKPPPDHDDDKHDDDKKVLRDTTEVVDGLEGRGLNRLAPSILLATKTMRRVQPVKLARFTFGRMRGVDWSFDDKRVSNE